VKKLLIVDDSTLVRKQLTQILEEDGYEIDIAKNGKEAVGKAIATDYDAITMDIEMPIMNGLDAIRKIMKKNPTPILVISSLTSDGARETIEAMNLGAVDYVTKPGSRSINVETGLNEIKRKVRNVSRISRRRLAKKIQDREDRQYLTNINIGHPNQNGKVEHIVLIGSSTGGPGLIEQICSSLPSDFPHPVCIVQHMPEKFTGAFAERLNSVSTVTVKESEANEEIKNGVVYVAKGGVNLTFRKKVSGKIVVNHTDEVAGRFFTPSVDEMFLSSLNVFSPKDITAFLLTGIGEDGAEGMVEIKNKGGYTIAESEETATVYGMPREAYNRGGVVEQLPFPKILKKFAFFRGVN
jgi:two-component system chemotaxis response regulator CheB